MSSQASLIEHLTTLNQIAEKLNSAVDMTSALQSSLDHLVKLMRLETGWIFLREPDSVDKMWGKGYRLVAYHNLPPALALDSEEAWYGGCDCQGYCNKGELQEAYNEVRCTRLATAHGDKNGLVVHASAPLKTLTGEVLGIVNVAAPNWSAFSPEALALLMNVGSQMATALERARLFDLLRERRVDEQAALLDLSNHLLRHAELRGLIDYLVKQVCTLLQVDACALLLPTEASDQLVLHAAYGWKHDPVPLVRCVPNNEHTGPGLVMHTQRPLFIDDLQTSEIALWTSDWLQAENFRGHAVIPLIVDGNSIGTLVIDTLVLRHWTDDDIRFMSLMANQAALAIENARLQKAELQRQRLHEELAIGKQIQLSLLPATCPIIEGWQFVAFYQAAQQVGGDFYDFFELPMDKIGLVIADVAGKGVPAALIMALSRTIIRTVALSGRGPAAALVRSNELILADSNADVFLTVFYAALNPQTGQMVYSSGGHNYPLHFQASTRQVIELKSRGIVLGIFPSIQIAESETTISEGDVVVFYTDGVTEAMNHQYEEFGEARLMTLVNANAEKSAGEISQAIVQAIHEFIGEMPQSDDLTLLVIKRG